MCQRVSAGTRPRASTSACSRRHPRHGAGAPSLRLRVEGPDRHRRGLREAVTRAPNPPAQQSRSPGLKAGRFLSLCGSVQTDADGGLGRGKHGKAGPGLRQTDEEIRKRGPRAWIRRWERRVTFGQKQGEGKPQRRHRCQMLRNSGTALPARQVLLPADVACGHTKARPGARQEGPPTDPLLPPFLPARA